MYRSATPSHTGMSDDIWRPGGSIDRESAGAEDVWSTQNSTIKDDNPFEDSSINTGGGAY